MIDATRIRPPMTPYRITCTAEIVARAFQVRADSLLSPYRGNRIVSTARQALYALLYEQTSASLIDIGKRFDRHHTTVLHGIQQARAWNEATPAYCTAYQQARNEAVR